MLPHVQKFARLVRSRQMPLDLWRRLGAWSGRNPPFGVAARCRSFGSMELTIPPLTRTMLFGTNPYKTDRLLLHRGRFLLVHPLWHELVQDWDLLPSFRCD